MTETARSLVMVLVLVSSSVAMAVPASGQSADGDIVISATVLDSDGQVVAQAEFVDGDPHPIDRYGWGIGANDGEYGYFDNLSYQNGTTIESFEDGDISEYSGSTSYFQVVNDATDGTEGLRADSDGNNRAIVKDSDIADAPGVGDAVTYQTKLDSSTRATRFWLANGTAQNANGEPESGYFVRINSESDTDGLSIRKQTNGGSVDSGQEDFDVQAGEWYTIRVSIQQEYTVEGEIRDQGGNAINDATIAFREDFVEQATSNATGYYNVTLPNGTYSWTASKGGYEDDTGSVTVNGSSISNVDATLTVDEDVLELQVPERMKYNETRDYTVLVNGSEPNGTSGSLSTVDDFEDQDIAEYGGDTGSYTVQSSVVDEGQYALEGESDTAQTISSVSGLDTYPESGGTIRAATNVGSFDARSSFFFATRDETNSPGGYEVRISEAEQDANLYVDSTNLDSTSANIDAEWHYLIIEWTDAGDIDIAIRDSQDTLVGTLNATDDTYGSGGIGYQMSTGGGTVNVRWDNITYDTRSGTSVSVTSNKTDLISVNETAETLTSSNESDVVGITAETTIDGDTVARTERVTVAETTLQDVTLLPASWALLAIVTDLGFVALFAGILISSAICRASKGEDLVCIGVSAVWVIGSWAFLEAIPLYIPVMALVGVGLILFGE